MRLLPMLFLLTLVARAQWTIQAAPTTADLRGIDNLGGGMAWASGSGGTVLHTVDGGATWLRCATPPGAETLDFRGVQAFDAKTAIVMSSGTGDLSRLYKTSDGCATWTLVFTNPDKDGFFDALRLPAASRGRSNALMLIGDPVQGHFRIWSVKLTSTGRVVIKPYTKVHPARAGEAIFAASNSALVVGNPRLTFWFATGGSSDARVFRFIDLDSEYGSADFAEPPVGTGSATSGIFSLAFALSDKRSSRWGRFLAPRGPYIIASRAVAVGGDYAKPDDILDVAAYCSSEDAGWGRVVWHAAVTQPHGYRSAVAYDPTTKSWITVGPNGTDVSTDDGRNWRALRPGPGDAADADKNWNALSLPFVVGPRGRIGVLNGDPAKE